VAFSSPYILVKTPNNKKANRKPLELDGDLILIFSSLSPSPSIALILK
jgi:hypothetical protein